MDLSYRLSQNVFLHIVYPTTFHGFDGEVVFLSDTSNESVLKVNESWILTYTVYFQSVRASHTKTPFDASGLTKMVSKTQLTALQLRTTAQLSQQLHDAFVEQLPPKPRAADVNHHWGPKLDDETDSAEAHTTKEKDIELTAQRWEYEDTAIDCEDTTSVPMEEYITRAQQELLGSDYAQSSIFHSHRRPPHPR
jgi:hypothetical protein